MLIICFCNKQLNNLYFEVNKNESKSSILKVSPDDFEFPEEADIAKREAKQKFLKKYLKMKKQKQKEYDRIRTMKKQNMSMLELDPDIQQSLNTSLPQIYKMGSIKNEYSQIHNSNRKKKNIDLDLINTTSMSKAKAMSSNVSMCGRPKESAIKVQNNAIEAQNSIRDTVGTYSKHNSRLMRRTTKRGGSKFSSHGLNSSIKAKFENRNLGVSPYKDRSSRSNYSENMKMVSQYQALVSANVKHTAKS